MKRGLKWSLGAVGALLVILLALLGGAKLLWTFSDAPPEAATGFRDVPVAEPAPSMVAAAHPLAVRAGNEILQAGGSAVDAAIAVQMVLNVVEPQSSGIGGGAFMLHWSAEQRSLQAFDGRETAPAAITERLFLHPDGTAYDFVEAVVGGRAVGVPGVLRMLELAHQQHGVLPWKRLFQPAIAIARQGFEVTPRLHLLTRWDPLLRTQPAARHLFYEESGRALPVGSTLRNLALADAFERIAEEGADIFYKGELAQDIVQAVQEAKRPSAVTAAVNYFLTRGLGAPSGTGWLASVPNPGFLTAEDLAGYQAVVREPVCINYRRYRVCGFPPPTSGGITVLQVLGMLSHLGIERYPPTSAEAMHLIAEAERLAFADRNLYIGDPDFVQVPTAGLLDPDYLRQRANLIQPQQISSGEAGTPPGVQSHWHPSTSPERPSTSHLSVADAAGNVVSMTTSIENVFGSRVMVRGFLLNNQLTDFSFVPTAGGRKVANALAPGKRPRSSMAPLIVFNRETHQPVLSIGSPGGSRIIGYVAQATLGVLAWDLDPQRAVSLPHVVNRGGVTELEDQGWDRETQRAVAQQLEAWGHEVTVGEQNSGLHAILRGPRGWVGGADPRREGVAWGDPAAARPAEERPGGERPAAREMPSSPPP